MIKIGKNISEFSSYSCQPKDKEELEQIIKDRISKEGSKCDLNDIDVSLIEDMSWLFYNSKFNGDISNWDVSNVKKMEHMFAYSYFTGDISKWDVRNVNDMREMFMNSKFNSDLSKWNVSKVKSMYKLFIFSVFDQDISNWNIRKNCTTIFIFNRCPIRKEYKPKLPK